MTGPGGVPAGHAVAVEVAVVVLQLLQAVKPHKAVLALFLHAQEVLPPACRLQPLVTYFIHPCELLQALIGIPGVIADFPFMLSSNVAKVIMAVADQGGQRI